MFCHFPRVMARISALFCCVVWHLVAYSTALLSDDLLNVQQRNQKSPEDTSTDLAKLISESSGAINAAAASILDSTSSPNVQRATASCTIAALIFPAQVFNSTSSEYPLEEDVNWSQTCWLPSNCFIRPRSAQEVALLLKVIAKVGCKFAVRGRGHNPNPGFSSVDSSGILLDLRDLNSLALDQKGVLHAGPGNSWGDLWDAAEASNRTVAGAREQEVGISGCLLGGGMPYFSSQYGLATDNVKNYEVVLANSTIIYANATENPELFRALKGGGSNLGAHQYTGLVTRFDIDTYPLLHTQYSINTYNTTDYAYILNATVQVQEAMEFDSRIDIFVTFSPSAINVGLFYADWAVEPPAVFKPFYNLESLIGSPVPLANGIIVSLTSAFAASSAPYDARRSPSAATTMVDYDLYIKFYEQFLSIAQSSSMSFPANLSYTIEPMSSAMVQKGEDLGGNLCGLPKVSQTWWSLVVEWQDEADDAVAQRTIEALQDSIDGLSRDRDLLLDFQFMNHAGPTQKVLESYGEANFDQLKSVAQRYDPNGLFQNLQNNGFLVGKP
ncbi:FAD-binding domain-containing protein [Annulohypoxylon truncatum]|uniref:FAD-binding domain-containing protein n=1 Tax=Annulohypoxylon truncatum TaxID=327061 RepID=UPI002007F2C0|nr:FAD-binding domain-containing protein [Annulohypoxylon truncatum]KAI1213726.1 FAD-binding domain-containing protein [Annulohypoxylon truncatum]